MATATLAPGHAHLLTPPEAAAFRAALDADTCALEVISGEAGWSVVDARTGTYDARPFSRPHIADDLGNVVLTARSQLADVLILPRSAVQKIAYRRGESPEHEHKLTSHLDTLAAGTSLLVVVESRYTDAKNGVLA